ncbi:hypothetical protein HDU93_003312 [Gonapodya sp. JEL0774]|nr:hypothetical protein HDU93_003312 [Gonapodya sp. JEL0774]
MSNSVSRITHQTTRILQFQSFSQLRSANRRLLPVSRGFQTSTRRDDIRQADTTVGNIAGQPATSQQGSERDQERLTHFGFKTVREEEKESLVGQVFANVADKYDLMNDLMSAGVHRIWKDHFIRTLAPSPTTKLLDVAGGTGDIAFRFLNYVRAANGGIGNASVTVLDINPSMLEVGKKRAVVNGYGANSANISWRVGNAEKLEGIPDNSYDAYTIAFGIRNCTHIDQVLKEAYRVLKPGGRFMCLEFGKVETPVVSNVYDLFSFEIIPVIGQVVANDRDSYQYLVESIRKFPPQPTFRDMIRNAGFLVVGQGWEDLTFGVAAIHSGYKV